MVVVEAPGGPRLSWWSRWRPRRHKPAPAHADTAAAPQVPEVEGLTSPADPWRPIAGEFALRLLTLTWEAVHHIGQAEQAEPDPQRRTLLFQIDHTITRTRRLAENLRVLAGEAVDDPDRQTITLQDVARAAGAAAEHYERLRFGPIVDLAVTADAADDVIRVLTELIDNADRYSPPDQSVSVAGHLTGDGEVLLRVEDNGIGIPPERLQALNHLMSKGSALSVADLQPSRIGLPVVAVLTRRHPSLRAWLSRRSTGGTVAMLRIGVDLLCEVPLRRLPPGPVPAMTPRHAQRAVPAASPQAIPRPRSSSPPPAGIDLETTAVLPVARDAPPPMPRRTPASIRIVEHTTPAVEATPYRTQWHDDAEAFNAGVDAARRDKSATPHEGFPA